MENLFRSLAPMVMIVALYSNHVFAAAFTCSGQVQTVSLGPASGMLQVNAGHGVHYLCQFDEVMNGIHPETCKAWYAMFLSALASGKEVQQSYDGTSGGATNCSELGSWVVPNPMPYYVQVSK